MAIPRFFYRFPLADAVQVELAPAAARHAAKVLRLRRGDEIVLFDGAGGEYEASIAGIGRDAVIADVGRFHALTRQSTLRICLAQGLASGDKMGSILQKAVELGVSRFQPLATRKSVIRLTEERAARRAQHWQQVTIAACEQSGANCIPDVLPVEDFDSWLASGSGLRLLLLPAAAQKLSDVQRPQSEVMLLAGPEGGLADSEVAAALAAGFIPVRVGPRILRTETAGLAALAAMQALWGDF